MDRPMSVAAAALAVVLMASGSAVPAPQLSDRGGAAANPYLRHPVVVGSTNPYLREPAAGHAATSPYLRHPVIVGPTNPYLKEPGAGGTNSRR
jgi:hypothetical protein